MAIFFLTNSMTSTLDMTSQTPTGKDTIQSVTSTHAYTWQHHWLKNWQEGLTITGKYNELVVWSEVNCDHLWVSCRKRRHRCIRIACLRSL